MLWLSQVFAGARKSIDVGSKVLESRTNRCCVAETIQKNEKKAGHRFPAWKINSFDLS
jgi:hypothetical protein